METTFRFVDIHMHASHLLKTIFEMLNQGDHDLKISYLNVSFDTLLVAIYIQKSSVYPFGFYIALVEHKKFIKATFKAPQCPQTLS